MATATATGANAKDAHTDGATLMLLAQKQGNRYGQGEGQIATC